MMAFNPQSSYLALLVIFYAGITCAAGSRILLATFSFSSHVLPMTDLGEALVARGHDAYIIVSPTYPEIDQMRNGSVKVIEHHAPEKDMYTAFTSEEYDDRVESAFDVTMIEDVRTTVDGLIQMCTNPLNDDMLFAKLKGLAFDLAIVDVFPCSLCYLILMYRLHLPYVGLTTLYDPWHLRNPALPSFVPFNMGRGYSDKMTFWERLDNIWTLMDWIKDPQVPYMSDDLVQKYAPDMPPVSLNFLAGRSQLWLIDTDFVIDYPRPLMPNEILVGGLNTDAAQALPADLQSFMDDAKDGVIVVSFGSFKVNLPADVVDRFLSAFEQVKQRVVWSFPGKPPKGIPGHILLMSWIPQKDLLGHPNTKVFITHCGSKGQFEALYHGVPMINFPLFAEQHYNARELKARGLQ